jgi:predicted DNA-binding transcriptional regulator AlpA
MKPKPRGILMTQKDIESEIGIGRKQVIRLGTAVDRSKSGGFPEPVRVVGRTYFFNRAEVERWAAGFRPPPASEGGAGR